MQRFSPDDTFYFYRGRVALYALLRALDLQPGDEVLVPGFTCIAVPSPILGLRARPIYVDIDPHTYNLDPADLETKISKRSKVIVAQHTFGIPCDMDAILAIANRYGLAVIEDTCHVWGGKYKDRDLGSIGIAAFYSYDPGKPFIIGMGGAATVNTPSLRAAMQDLEHLFHKPPASEIAKLHLQYAAHRLTRHPRLFWRIRDAYRFLSRNGVAIATWTADSLEGRLGPDYGKSLAPSLKSRLANHMLRGDQVIGRHKGLAARYERGLHALGLPEAVRNPGAEPVLICYPIQVAEKTRLLDQARKHSVEMGDWFSSPVHPLPEREWKTVAYEKGSCPAAETVSTQVVTLPCHAGVTGKEADRTLAFLSRMKQAGILDFVSAAVAKQRVEASPAGVRN
jgi:dTDP-4-amino-4,6-dideoxygalactose transaminase